jgi:hypothetical protein
MGIAKSHGAGGAEVSEAEGLKLVSMSLEEPPERRLQAGMPAPQDGWWTLSRGLYRAKLDTDPHG